MTVDLVIRNGAVLDGTGAEAGPPMSRSATAASPPRRGAGGGARARCNRLSRTPGFIDIHSHSDFTLLVDPRAASAVHQGVTLEVVGNCGFGCFPLLNKELAPKAIYGQRPTSRSRGRPRRATSSASRKQGRRSTCSASPRTDRSGCRWSDSRTGRRGQTSCRRCGICSTRRSSREPGATRPASSTPPSAAPTRTSSSRCARSAFAVTASMRHTRDTATPARMWLSRRRCAPRSDRA